MLPKSNSKENLDRFIPNRSAMDFDFAHYRLTCGKIEKENSGSCSPSKQLYKKHLAEILNINRTRILSFKNRPMPPSNTVHGPLSPVPQTKSVKKRRQISQSPERILLEIGKDFIWEKMKNGW